MRKLHLQRPSRVSARSPKISRISPVRSSTFAVPGLLQIALLDRAHDMIDDDEAGLMLGDQSRRSPRPCRSPTASPASGRRGARSRPRARRGRWRGRGQRPPRDGPRSNAPPSRAERRCRWRCAARACPRRSGTSTMARVGTRRRSTGPRRDDLGGAWACEMAIPAAGLRPDRSP